MKGNIFKKISPYKRNNESRTFDYRTYLTKALNIVWLCRENER